MYGWKVTNSFRGRKPITDIQPIIINSLKFFDCPQTFNTHSFWTDRTSTGLKTKQFCRTKLINIFLRNTHKIPFWTSSKFLISSMWIFVVCQWLYNWLSPGSNYLYLRILKLKPIHDDLPFTNQYFEINYQVNQLVMY